MNQAIQKTMLVLALATLAMQANAHRGWLLPQATNVESKQAWVTIDGAISENLFEINHVALKLDEATVTGPDGVTSKVPAPAMGKQRSSFDLNMIKDGTYKISLVSQSVTGSYKDQASGATKRFRSSADKVADVVPADASELKTNHTHARLETFVSANIQTSGALKPSGVGLEMVPLTHPTDLRSGETAKWRFQLGGQPLANFAFSLTQGGVRYRGLLGEIRLSTDAKGEAEVRLPQPGMYWLHASFPEVRVKGAEAPERSYTYAATLEILPE